MPIVLKTVGLEAFRESLKKRSRAKPISEAVYQTLVNAWYSGIDAFIRTAVRQVLIETGMSAATFFPLSRAIRRATATNAIQKEIDTRRGQGSQPAGGHRRKAYDHRPHLQTGARGKDDPKQNVLTGIKEGRKAYKINLGSSRAPFFRFAFEVRTFQMRFHNENDAALLEGEKAFLEITRKRFVRDANFVINEWLATGRARPRLVE